MRALKALALAALLVGCGQTVTPSESTNAAAPMMAAEERASGGEAQDQAAPSPQPHQPSQQPQDASYLAYTYGVSMELPAANVAGLMDAHVRACQQAGPRLCQLISSSRSGDPESAVSGTVEIRGEPTWLRRFMDGLSGQVGAAGGRITGQTTAAEDLTRDIVDTEARLRASHTLRDRLQQLLASRPGKLSDLLDIERELARVQGEIDSTESQLAVMRARVDMSVLTLTYSSTAQSIRSDTFKPLGDALAGFLGWIVIGVASIVTVIAILLPWVVVIWLIVWLVLTLRRRMGGRFFKRRPPETPPPAANS
ncbi:MAG TPA: DUF4349 domain-containing protein [Caulobacterales bacterium]|nr:DUF4349 domain-containing protein [Caulobacterales bacterium]